MKKHPKPVPPEIIISAINEFNEPIARLIDQETPFTDFEVAAFCWFSKFHTLMFPFVGHIVLPPFKEPHVSKNMNRLMRDHHF